MTTVTPAATKVPPGSVIPPSTHKTKAPVPAPASKQPAVNTPRVLAIESFYSKEASLLSEDVVIEAARSYGIEPELLMAFAKVESPRGPFMPDGRPYILYEPHVFSRCCSPKHKYDEDHPLLSSKEWDSKLYGPGGDNQYRKLAKAMELDTEAALSACSWGSYQVLGENWKMLGFESAADMVLFMVESEANQFDVFMRFLNRRGIIAALRAKDFDTALYKYNGPRYREHGYDTRFLAAYRDLTSHTIRQGHNGPKVLRLQKLLAKFGFKVELDGVFGPETVDAVKSLQRKWGVTVDGVVGAQTYERLASERVEETSLITSKRMAGAAVTATTGAAVIVEGTKAISEGATQAKGALDQLREIQDISGTTKQVVVSARDATEQVLAVQQQSSSALIVLGIVLLAIAVYFVWTKRHDLKKAAGVK